MGTDVFWCMQHHAQPYRGCRSRRTKNNDPSSTANVVEENEGLHPHIRRTKTPNFVHVYCSILPMNRVFFLASALCLVRPTLASTVLQRGQDIQALPKDRCFVLPNYENPEVASTRVLRHEGGGLPAGSDRKSLMGDESCTALHQSP